MNEQKLNKKENTINPNKTKGQIDCLVINFLAEGCNKIQCRWDIEHRGDFFITYKQCDKEATKIIKNLSGTEIPFCDRHAKLTMTRSEKYKIGFTIRDISQKDL